MSEGGFLVFMGVLLLLVIIAVVIAVVSAVSGAAAAIAETGKADGVPEYLCRYTEATVRYLKETSKK